jgi:hypothetical protein
MTYGISLRLKVLEVIKGGMGKRAAGRHPAPCPSPQPLHTHWCCSPSAAPAIDGLPDCAQAEYLQLCDAVLQEEKRSYAANGRLRGGLGSLNVTLQSEPNFGWTTVGQIPQLLWPQGQGVMITSANMTRLPRIETHRLNPEA